VTQENPKSLCALEARVESLQLQLAECMSILDSVIAEVQLFAENQTLYNEITTRTVQDLIDFKERY
jgi:hypothetical protein